MDKAVAEALEGSIHKWEKVVDEGVSGLGMADCNLCDMFYIGKSSCTGCPVAFEVMYIGCGNTPYHEYSDAAQEFGLSDPRTKRCAEQELEFLKGLRDE